MSKTEDRLKRARIAIMKHPKFCAFSGVLSCGSMTLDATLNPPTAATNCWDTKFHPAFVDTLSDSELRFVMIHEAVHAAYKHLHVWKSLWNQNRRLTNIAADHFVNLAIHLMDAEEGFVTMPKVGIQPNMKYKGWSVEQIYRDLLQQQQQQQQQDQSGGQGDGQGDGFDEHDFESAADHSDEVQQARAHEIDRALRQGEMLARKLRGKGAGGADALIEDLLAPKVDWREQLREFVREVCQGRDESTWSRPNRRYIGSDAYMPSMYSEKMGDLVVIWDTSGSCFDSGTVTRFGSELKAAVDTVKPERIVVMYVDWGVRSVQEFTYDTFEISAVRPQGGGGTDLSLGFDYLRNNRITPTAAVVFTDGETPYGLQPDFPVLWCLTARHSAPPWGVRIYVEA